MKERETIKWNELLEKAKEALRKKNYAQTERYFSILLDSCSSSQNKGIQPYRPPLAKAQIIMSLAEAKYKLSKFSEAISLYEQYTQLSEEAKEKNGDLLAQIKQARVMSKDQKWKEAEILLKGIINRPQRQLDSKLPIHFCGTI
jgi:hypothetical protein